MPLGTLWEECNEVKVHRKNTKGGQKLSDAASSFWYTPPSMSQSWSWVPRSMTAPDLTTRTLSAILAFDILWVTKRVATRCLLVTFLIPDRREASERASRLAVTSSRRRTDAEPLRTLRSPRAMATLALWPPLRLNSVPSSKVWSRTFSSMKSSQDESLTASMTSSSVASGSPYAMF